MTLMSKKMNKRPVGEGQYTSVGMADYRHCVPLFALEVNGTKTNKPLANDLGRKGSVCFVLCRHLSLLY